MFIYKFSAKLQC